MRLLPGSEQLRDVLRAIERAFREIWPAPFRTQQLEAADLPEAAPHKGGIVYDLTAGALALSDGAQWKPLYSGTDPLGTMAFQDADAVAIAGGSATGMSTVSATALFGTTVAGTGITAFGTAYMNRACRQPLSGERYLLLVNKSANNRAIIGNVRGRRNQGSGAGNNMGDFYVFILCSSSLGGGWRVHWEVKRTNNAVRLVELIHEGEAWYAMDAITTGASSPFDGAAFEGCIADPTAKALTWVLPGAVSDVVAVGSDATVNFGNMAVIQSGAFYCQSGTTASAANLHQASSGSALLRSTSSARYKTDVRPIDFEKAKAVVRALNAVTYRSLSEADHPDWRWPGFVAEEVAAVCPNLVQWRPLGEGERPVAGTPTIATEAGALVPESVMYDRIAVYQNVVLNRLLDGRL